MDKFKHLQEDCRHLALQDKESRIQILNEDTWINYPRVIEILQVLKDVMNQPKKSRMQSLLIIGESNMGKSSLVKKFAELNPDYSFEDDLGISHPSKPVIVAESPASADERGLYSAILDKFWAPYRPNDTVAKLRHQAIYLLRECQVKILILDELHNLLAGTPAKQRMVMNVLKSLSNELLIPIVGVGTQDAALTLHSDPQHASRFDIISLPRWNMDKDFKSLLMAIESRLPLQRPSNLGTREKGSILYAISRGNLGDLYRLIVECAIYAIKEGHEEITLDIINRHNWLQLTNGARTRKI